MANESQTVAALPDEALLRLPQVLALFPVSRAGWWHGVRTGKYPAPLHLGPRLRAWRMADIRKILANPPAA